MALLWVGPLAIVTLGGIGLPQATAFFTAQAWNPSSGSPAGERVVVGTALRVSLLIALLLTAIYLGLVIALTSGGDEIRDAALLSSLFTPLLLLQGVGVGALQGMRNFNWFNVCRVAPLLLYAPLAALVAVLGWATLLSLISLFVVSLFCASLLTWLAVGRLLPDREPTEASFPARRMLSFGLRGLLGDGNPTEQTSFDQLVVGLLTDPRGLGLYASAASFTNLTRFVAQSIGAVAFPRIAASKGGAQKWNIAERALAIGTAGVLLVLASLEAALPFLIELLFGKDFIDAVPIGRILLVAGALMAIKRLLTDLARGLGHPGYGSIAEIVTITGFFAIAFGFALLGSLSPDSVALAVLAGGACGVGVLGAKLMALRRRSHAGNLPF